MTDKPLINLGNKTILGLRTDSAEATIILASYRPKSRDIQSSFLAQVIDRSDWTAGRQLSATLLTKIDELLQRNHKTWADLAGLVAYQGPGSFTGLRIGLTVANTAAFTLNIPIVGSTGDDWLERGASRLIEDNFTDIITPVYGGEPNITKPKK